MIVAVFSGHAGVIGVNLGSMVRINWRDNPFGNGWGRQPPSGSLTYLMRYGCFGRDSGDGLTRTQRKSSSAYGMPIERVISASSPVT
jgi:hypothetical protein